MLRLSFLIFINNCQKPFNTFLYIAIFLIQMIVIQMRLFVICVTILAIFSQRIDPSTIPKFVTNLSFSHPAHKPTFNEKTGRPTYTIIIKENTVQMLPPGYPQTKVYAYGGQTYDPISGTSLGVVHCVPGPTFLIQNNTEVTSTWENTLTGKHMFTIEKNLDYMYDVNDYDNFIPTVAHAHGMANPALVDGNAAAWFTSRGEKGNQYYSENLTHTNRSTITWSNQQGESTLLYHDHSMAMTRLNFYAGLYGFLVIEDPSSHLSKIFNKNHDIFLAIKDAAFNKDGSLFYPSEGVSEVYPSWVPEFYGDVFMVNGKVWPNLNVQKNLYRVRLLNACNSRNIEISFVEQGTNINIPFKLFKADSSYYDEPILLSEVEIPIAGRIEIAFDFSLVTTKRVIMKNVYKYSHSHQKVDHLTSVKDPGIDPITHVMAFTISAATTTKVHLPVMKNLNPHLSEFPFPAPSIINKYAVLVEAQDDFGNPVGTFIDGLKMSFDTEVYELSRSYDLYIINLTPDTHPMHIHLINFQFYKQADINAILYAEDWYVVNGGKPPYMKRPVIMDIKKYMIGEWIMLDGVKRVFRDLDNILPSTVAVFRFRFRHNNGQAFGFNTRIGEYIWHCHILEHEDNEMMRPFVVVGF